MEISQRTFQEGSVVASPEVGGRKKRDSGKFLHRKHGLAGGTFRRYATQYI